MKRLSFLLAIFLLAISCHADEPVIPAMPNGEEVFPKYEVFVNGKPVPVYSCRVSAWPLNWTWPGYQRPLDQTEKAGFAYWGMTEKVQIEVVSKTVPNSVTIRPQSLGIKPKCQGNRISFTLDQARPIVLEVNDFHEALHLFPYTPEPVPDRNKPGLRYFGPGVHNVGVIEMKSNESVYIDAGAVVYGTIFGQNIENVSVGGRGILDGSKIVRGEKIGDFPAGQAGGVLKFVGCKNVRVDGLIQKDPAVWTDIILCCKDVTISNLRLIGLWRYNSDGIDVCNSERVTVENCFVRAFDDALVLKGLPGFRNLPNRNVTFRGCTVWCDWGRALEIGAETCCPENANIVFEDCDVIRTTGIAMDIQHYDEARVHDIRFENIRLEFDDWIPREVFQSTKNQKYKVDKKDPYCSRLMVIVLPAYRAPWSSEKHGTADNIIFKNIVIYSNRMPPSTFDGFSEQYNIDGVRIENVRFAGKEPILDAKSMNLQIGKFVKNVTIGK